MTEMVWVGSPGGVSTVAPFAGLLIVYSPEKGLIRRTSNSPDGGGAMERGILVDMWWCCGLGKPVCAFLEAG